MAKICSFYGSSPTFSSMLDFGADDFCIAADPIDFNDLPSICGDVEKMNSGSDSQWLLDGSPLDIDIKHEFINASPMWSPPPNCYLSTSASSDIGTAAPPSAVMGHMAQAQATGSSSKANDTTAAQRPAPPTVVVAKKLPHLDIVIKQEPDVEQQLQHHSIPNSKLITATMQHIPPGTSLLRKSANQAPKKTTTQSRCSASSLPKRGDRMLPSAANVGLSSSSYMLSSSSSSSCSSNSSSSSGLSLCQRPDTPPSLDDDSVDLEACLLGSNNISLATDRSHLIHNISQELQDPNKKQIHTRLNTDGNDLTDVMEVIHNEPFQPTDTMPSSPSSLSNCPTVMTSSSNSSSSLGCPEGESDDESSIISPYSTGGVSPMSDLSNIICSRHPYALHTDHSYTRCKDGMDEISNAPDTPSDSEEEIDVVSINDKKLPTNPSDRDRRALQTKVAHKFSASRVVKTPNGVRTLPPTRHGYELPYTPASNSPVKSLASSRFPSPAATPYHGNSKYMQQQQMIVMGSDGSASSLLGLEKPRKRLMGGNSELLASKKHRGKKVKQHVLAAVQLPDGLLKRQYSLDETADTIEKRNLHNDMERQRRIGLKNLFEALKKQIPSIKDKERAPKVNILREAAKLCEALTREDAMLMEQKARLKEEQRRKQELVNRLTQLQAQQQQQQRY